MGKKLTAVAALVGVFGGAGGSVWGGPVFSMSDQVASGIVRGPLGNFATAGSGYFDFLGDLSVIGFITASAANQNAALPGDTITIGTIAFAPTNLNTSTVTPIDLIFDYRVTLTDAASSASGTFDVLGELQGSETASPTSITTSFYSIGLTTNTLSLGGNLYSVAIGSHTGPSANAPGVIQLNVSVPEPVTGGFIGCGLAVTLLTRRRGSRV